MLHTSMTGGVPDPSAEPHQTLVCKVSLMFLPDLWNYPLANMALNIHPLQSSVGNSFVTYHDCSSP